MAGTFDAEEFLHLLRVHGAQLQTHAAAVRPANQIHLINIQRIQQQLYILCQLVHGVEAVVVGAVTKAAQIGGNAAEAALQTLDKGAIVDGRGHIAVEHQHHIALSFIQIGQCLVSNGYKFLFHRVTSANRNRGQIAMPSSLKLAKPTTRAAKAEGYSYMVA